MDGNDKSIKVLLVEDSPTQAEQLKHLLEQHDDYHVSVASNGKQALALINKHKPTMVISDIIMPEMDGYEMCHAIKHDEALKDIPVMLLTSLSNPEDIIRGLQARADSYVTKPYDEEYLLYSVESLLGNPVRKKSEELQEGLEINFAGKRHVITSDRRQILNLLLSTYEGAIRQNSELIKTQLELKKLNEQLEERVKERTQQLQASEANYRTLLESSVDAIVVANPDGIVRFVNPAAEALFDRKAEELLGELFGFPLMVGEATELDIIKRSGETVTVDMRVVETEWAGESVYLASMRDITRRKRAEERLLHDAFHSALTGLPNRALFMDRLGRAFERMKQGNDFSFAVLFLDIDRFKLINSSLGQAAGDKVLISASQKLELCVRKVDTVAHLGGDEFAILLEDIEYLGGVMQFVDRVQKDLASPLNVKGHEIFMTISIGICLSSTDYDKPETLLRNAETAMHRAKHKGGECYEIFDKEMHTQALRNLQLESELRRAIERQQLRVYYQPIVSLSNGKITGFEPLIRWQHPERGLVPPAEFIHLARETGLIVPISEISLQTACEQNQAWKSQGFPPMYASVNIAAIHFRQHNFTKSVARVLQNTGTDPHSLVLELVESSIVENVETNLKTLREICEMGVGISIDDFGTGYSSLSYLKRFPINIIKIDRSFVLGLPNDPDDSAIVTAIITMAQSLKLKVIAEGVETQEQLTFLRSLNCDEMQGYLFSRPLPAKGFALLLQEARHLSLGI